MTAPKSRKTRMPLVAEGASKCLRYVHTCSQLTGSQFCQDSGATVCGRVTVANALSSNPGRLLPAAAGPNSQPVLNGTVAAAEPRLAPPAATPAAPPAAPPGAPPVATPAAPLASRNAGRPAAPP